MCCLVSFRSGIFIQIVYSRIRSVIRIERKGCTKECSMTTKYFLRIYTWGWTFSKKIFNTKVIICKQYYETYKNNLIEMGKNTPLRKDVSHTLSLQLLFMIFSPVQTPGRIVLLYYANTYNLFNVRNSYLQEQKTMLENETLREQVKRKKIKKGLSKHEISMSIKKIHYIIGFFTFNFGDLNLKHVYVCID